MKCQMMVRVTKNLGEYDAWRNNIDYYSGIYMTSVMEAQCHIIYENWIEQEKI